MPTTAVMGNVSRPLIGVLVATVAFFALWLVALKPSSSSSSSSSQGLGQYQGAINSAHNAVKVASGAAAAQGGNLAKPSAAPAQPATTATPGQHAATTTPAQPAGAAKPSNAAAKPATKAVATRAGAGTRLRLVERALRRHRVLAMLFYNPAAADDRAVRQELATVPGHKGRVVKLAVPISEVSNYQVVTNQVNVAQAPTLVLINPAAQASLIVGFADTFEIAQRVDDALAVK